jgi:signal transduction histidine kinase
LIWIALRFGQLGSSAAVFAVSLIAVWCTYLNFNSSSDNGLGHHLLLLQSFMGITAVTFMVMAAVVSEGEHTRLQQQRLAQKTTLLSKQRVRLLALNKAKDEFVAIASHQLRTPATAVKQYISLMLDGYSGHITKDQRQFLQRAYENNESQLRIVDDILQVAKLDLGKMKLELKTHDIGKILEKAISSLGGQVKSNDQSIHLIKPAKRVLSVVDGRQLRLVLEGLIENASNYSPKDSEIIVRLYSPRSKMIEICVEDEGVGINPSDYKFLFKKFSRINNPLSHYVNGSGLGLYFCKKVVDLHKGNLKVSQNTHGGCIFTVSLPHVLKIKNSRGDSGPSHLGIK